MATGTKLMKEISDQFLICRICLQPFKDPKTLSCLHTFCCACVQQQYDNDATRPSRYTLYARAVSCPVCRKKTELPAGGVRRLPDNFLVSNLTEVLAKRRCSSKVPPCEICHTVRSRSSEACCKCLDCDKLLCRACVELHSSTKVTQDHSLIDLQGQKDIECKAHPEETVRFYCERCEECICVVCTFQEHKDHEVCSFNDGLVKHKAALEGLLGRSRERLEELGRRLKMVDQVETLSKELKERIRDLAISYTSQVRAREKELVGKVDEMLSGEVSQLAEKKSWLQQTRDSLQSAKDLTEMVVRDKGVEMLLLKKELQAKMDLLLSPVLPPEPPDLHQLDLTFVPGQVQLGDILIPGKRGEQVVVQSVKNGSDVNAFHAENVDSHAESVAQDISQASAESVKSYSQPCRACLKRKRREEREKVRSDEHQTREERRKMTKSVQVQTKTQETSPHDPSFPGTVSQGGAGSSSVEGSNSSTHIYNASESSCGTGSDSMRRHTITANKPSMRARGTMTARQDVRTLKIQTEDSCLRDIHLGHAAPTGSAYPNTGAAITAAFLKRNINEEDTLTRSWPMERQGEIGPFPARATQDAQVSTDISLGLTNTDAVAALCQGEGRVGVGVNGSDPGTPDLLAETGSVPVPAPSLSSWIRSRKVQTELSALDAGYHGEDQCIIDGEMKRAVFLSSGSSSRSQSIALSMSKDARASHASCDVGVMTSFKVKLTPDTVERDTITEAVTSHGVGVMTSPETRTVYIQTLMKRLRSTATGTDYEGQTSKSTGTQPVSAMDAETAMPQVFHDSKTTWTDAPMASERATSTQATETSDAMTLTTQVPTYHFSAQVRPESQDITTNTVPLTPLIHHQVQAAPSLTSTGTVPDSSHLAPAQIPEAPSISDPQVSSSPLSDRGHPTLSPVPSLYGPGETVGEARPPTAREDRGTGTESPQGVTIAAGPDRQMVSWRTVSTDTARLMQGVDKETWTRTVKTVEEWTNTPQPQLVTTGVTPVRPAIRHLGVATTPITVTDQAANTEIITLQDSATEHGLVVCDSDTLTEKVTVCDAQTGAEVLTESQSTCMEVAERADGSCMTEEAGESLPVRETHDTESQCQSPTLVHREVNTRRFRRKAKEVQTCYSYVECLLCEHPEKLERLTVTKTFTDTSTDPSPPDTHDVATMALSCLSAPPGLVHAGVQTSATSLCDKGVATSFDLDYDCESKPCLGLECQDAATSTESLPYIGLLSEIDVDELIVIPEANFELVSDSDEDSVSMVDDETLTEELDYVEVGTQTLPPVSGSLTASEPVPTIHRPQDDCSKHVVSVGVNTVPKVTFEKETSTPIRHLFSKGTMTFFVAKMDKATSTISHTRCLHGKQGAAAGGRVVREASRPRATDSKVTMTTRTEQRDMAVETDSTLVEGRITQCISKLRNVSERLNSPTLRKAVEGDVFFGQSFLSHRARDSSSLSSPVSPKYLSSPSTPPTDSSTNLLSPPRDTSNTGEAQRQTQLHNLLAETDALLKSRDSPGVRKAQPITTLRTRSSDRRGDVSNYASQSFPRPRSLDRQNKVKMGSQATSPSRLPLSRYHSAPGRIATVPPHILLHRKTGQTSPPASPSKIPVSQKAPPAITSTAAATSDTSTVESEAFSTSPTQKVQQRPSLPSISETRTPSSCSETSYVSMESGESSLNPLSVMTTSHSRTPSNVTTVSDTASDVIPTKSSGETLSTDCRESNEEDSSSACSTSTAFMATQPGTSPAPAAPSKPKKEKKGFMQRFLSGKKKKDSSSSDQEKEPSSKTQDKSKQPPTAPSLPQISKKQTPQPKTHTKGARPKNTQKKDKGKALPVTVSEVPPPPVSTSADGSRPSSADSTQFSLPAGVSACPSASAQTPALPPHHYPPLPDPSKTPPPPRKPRPFVYVRQRIFSIQQDNVEEVKERKEKEKEEKEKKDTEEKGKDQEGEKDKETEKDQEETQKEEEEKDKKETEREEKEKGKVKDKEQVKVGVNVKVKSCDKNKGRDEKMKEKAAACLGGDRAAVAAQNGKELKGKEHSTVVQTMAERGKKSSSETAKKPEKSLGSGKSEGKKKESRTRSWIRGK